MANIVLLVKEIKGVGGIQRNYTLWYEMFKKRGHNVYLIVVDEEKHRKDEHIIFLEGNFLKKVFQLNKILNEIGNIDLFLINAEYMKFFINRKFLNNHYITVHNTWNVRNRKFLRKFMFYIRMYLKYYNENLIGISKNVIDNIKNKLKIKIKSSKVIYAPHNFEKVDKLSKDGINEKNFIVSVGALLKRKRFDVLIEAFDLIKDKTDKNLLIIGEGPERGNLESLIKIKKLENRIRLLGFKENPYPYIKNADLLVLSSESEGLPRVIVEAFFFKTPVVSTYSSKGVYEIMYGDLKNYVVEKNNPKALADKIIEALGYYPEISDNIVERFKEENSYKDFMKLIK